MLSHLKMFPFEARQTFWAKKEEGWKELTVQQCMNRFTSLLSYYFTGQHGEPIWEDPMYRRLFGPLLAGIDNSKEWEEIVDVHFGGCRDPLGAGTNSTPEDCVVSFTFFTLQERVG